MLAPQLVIYWNLRHVLAYFDVVSLFKGLVGIFDFRHPRYIKITVFIAFVTPRYQMPAEGVEN